MPFHVPRGGCCDSRCLPQTPFSLFPHSSSHNLPRAKRASLHSFPTGSCEELLGFFFRRRCNTPQNCQNLLSSFPAEPSASESSSPAHLSHPLLWHSFLWPHFSLCNDTYPQKLTQHSWLSFLWHHHLLLHPFRANFVTQPSWCCLSREEKPLSQAALLLLVQSPNLWRARYWLRCKRCSQRC